MTRLVSYVPLTPGQEMVSNTMMMTLKNKMTTQRMMMMKLSCSLFTAAILVASTASPLHAETPWEPLKPNISAYVTDGIFDKSPLILPFTQVSVDAVLPDAYQPSQDFQHVYDASYEDVIAFFESEDARKNGVQIFDTSIFPEAKGLEVIVFGSQKEGNGMQYRMAHRQLSRDFTLIVEPLNGQTRVTFKNVVLTNVSSGVMPARAGYKATTFKEPVPFNWN